MTLTSAVKLGLVSLTGVMPLLPAPAAVFHLWLASLFNVPSHPLVAPPPTPPPRPLLSPPPFALLSPFVLASTPPRALLSTDVGTAAGGPPPL